MTITPTLDDVQEAVQAMHGCPCEHLTTGLVHEQMDGKTVWKGAVETFALKGHPKATKAYAWWWTEDDGKPRFIAVLNVPPINSPREAVQAAIASGKQK